MKIQKFEQSGFIIETNHGFRLAIDIGYMTPIEKLESVKVDAFLVSHLHGDHLSLEHINAISPNEVYLSKECIDELDSTDVLNITQIKSGQNFPINSIDVQVFDVNHGPNIKIVPKENFGFILTVDEQKIYFAGDMFSDSGIDVSNLEIDIALIPVGTFYTFGPEEAFNFVKKFKSIKKIIPMHYEKMPETPDEFINVVNGEFVIDKI